MHNLKDPFCLLPIEILCINLRNLWTKNGGELSINVFWTHPPHGGARRATCEKRWVEVLNCYPGNVCAKFGCDRVNGAGDEVVTDVCTDGLTESSASWWR